MKNKLLFFKTAIVFFALFLFSNANAQVLYTKVLVSDSGTTNTLGNANTSKNIAVAPNGMIGVVYVGSSGVRFAKSVNRGQSFLPSVKLSSATSGEAEINLAANGNIYIVHNNKIYISSDEGNTFTSNTYSSTNVSNPHITSYGDNVYISNVARIFRNFNNGKDTFYSYLIPGSHVFADVFADPATGDVFVPSDNPVVSLHKSVTEADTFVKIPVLPAISVFYSSYALSNNSLGSFLYAAGRDSSGLKFDLNLGTNAALTYKNNTGNNDRTLAADDLGDLVDGYKTGSRFSLRVSKNFGSSFDTTQYFLDSALNHNIAINTFTQDVVRAYTGTDGKIYLNVLQGLLLPRTVVLPTITTFGNLNPFSKCGSNASAAQSFRVKGVDLNKNILVKAPTGMQVSLNASSGFDSTLTLIPSSGKVDSVLVYVRMGANATGSITGKIACTSIGAVTKFLDVSGSITSLPTITVSSIADIYSNQTSFSIPFTATTGSPNQYSISTTSPNAMTGFVPVVNATLSSSPIIVNVPASLPNTYNFSLTVRNSNSGCSSQNLELNLKVVSPPTAPPTVITNGASAITATTAQLGGNVSDSGTAAVTERGVVYATTANPTTLNTKVQIGSGIGSFSQNITGLTASTTYHVRAYAINSVGTSYGADSTFTTPSIPTPTIVAKGTSYAFTTCLGSPSAELYFSVSGFNLTDNITITAPNELEISRTSGTGYSNSITLNPISGLLDSTPIFVRSKGTAIGVFGPIMLISSAGASTESLVFSSNVIANPVKPIISTKPVSPICLNTFQLNFGASTAATAGVTYNWSAENASVYAQGNTKQFSLVSFTTSGKAKVILTATAGQCSAKDEVELEVNNELSHSATVRYFNKNFVCEANMVNKYQWGYDNQPSLEGVVIANEINQNYFNAAPDFANKNYWVISSTATCYQKTYYNKPLQLIENQWQENGLVVYPNPLSDQLTLKLKDISTTTQLQVLDMQGKICYEQELVQTETTLDLAALAPGIYLVKCTLENNKIVTAKVVKN